MIKLVVGEVRNGGFCLDVVGVIVPADFLDQFGVAGFGLSECHQTRITSMFKERNKPGLDVRRALATNSKFQAPKRLQAQKPACAPSARKLFLGFGVLRIATSLESPCTPCST